MQDDAPRVLLIEDDPTVMRWTTRVLEEMGARVPRRVVVGRRAHLYCAAYR
jgi:CheY-like chemotaxis protein